MAYFKNPRTIEELRRQYTELLKKHHPDNGGSIQAAQEIIGEYKRLFERLKNVHEASENQTESQKQEYSAEMDEAIREALEKVVTLHGINIEICGTWIWITGNTYSVKNQIKAAGFRFSSNKKAWYFHVGEYHRSGKKRYSMDDIRMRHGSMNVQLQPQAALA